jgi:glutathione S-transferase
MSLPILIGQLDSPFVRRVAIAMKIYRIPFEHRPWSVFRDAEQIARFNPLRRVPTLVLPHGEVLVDSSAILDALDDDVPDEHVLLPRRGAQRRTGLRLMALACGMADKGVSLVYERVARESSSHSLSWVERCSRQVSDALLALERERASCGTRWWLGNSMTHVDVAVGVVVHFLLQATPTIVEASHVPALLEHEQRCHQDALFAETDQPLHFPGAPSGG